MNEIHQYFKEQYDLVRDARNILFKYCGTMSQSDFVIENPSFGRGGSVRNLLAHVANTYQFWIGTCALQKDLAITPYSSIQTVGDLFDVFATINTLMEEFISVFSLLESKLVSYEINGLKGSVKPFKLFTHVITHEFHHKGQVLSISRHLGYIPVDTDIMR
jgi:uncharacterized damage-inducible protein DinB